MEGQNFIIKTESPILVTGAAGFIGSKVVSNLLERGFSNIRCFVRNSSNLAELDRAISRWRISTPVEIFKGNLLSCEDCARAVRDVHIIYHLAAARGEKSFPDAFLNTVVTTRNLLEANLQNRFLRRFVNVSSFSVYSNRYKPHGRLLDESCPIEEHPETRSDAYSFAKIKQEEMVRKYQTQFGLPCVFVRPGVVYGPGNEGIHGRVGVGTFGLFLHLGGRNNIRLTYVDNCADAIVMAGIVNGVEGDIFNVVDDNLPSSRCFLRLYKQEVRRFSSIYVPRAWSYMLCYLWEKCAAWSEGQLPPTFNRQAWHLYWKGSRYSNEKLRKRLGWSPKVATAEGLSRYFESCKRKEHHA